MYRTIPRPQRRPGAGAVSDWGKCLHDIMVADDLVDKALFADPDREVFPVKARNLPQSMPHTYARTGPGIGWPGQPSRYCLGTGSYYTCTAMGNRAFALSREGNARMLAVLECAAVHGFPLWYCQQATQKELLKYFGNSICPPVAKAVHLSIEGLESHTRMGPVQEH